MLTLHLMHDEVEMLKRVLADKAAPGLKEFRLSGDGRGFVPVDQSRSDRTLAKNLLQRVIDNQSVPNFAAHIDIE